MFKENLRPYEISLWTLQDSFITVLKSSDISSRGQIETPRCQVKNDGTQELSFSIPMYYRVDGLLVENPIWYNVINGALIVNLRKLKLIFNKGEEGIEEVFEFVISRVEETHTDGKLSCEVRAEGLAFQELGKVGYKISLNSQDFLDDYEKWYLSEVGVGKDYSSQDEKDKAKPKNNIDYWCKKIFTNSKWDYEIQMDWSAFDGLIVDDISGSYNIPDKEGNEKEIIYNGTYQKAPKEIQDAFNKIREKTLRRLDRIYEEEYISSWEYQKSKPEEGLEDKLIPSNMEAFTEKLRLVDLEKSNIYNLTQSLAKAFGVFCKYQYKYGENYHIVGRKCIFYNNFLSEKDGKLDIIYPYDISKISREIDSADVVTKMFVVPIEDTTTASGLVTIADVPANKAREDYILNFDYLYSIGTITKEQYEYIQTYERSAYLVNTQLEPIALQINNLQIELNKCEAQAKIAQESIIQDIQQMEQASKTIAELTGSEDEEGNAINYFWKTRETPIRGVLQKMDDSSGRYYIKVSQEGIDTKSLDRYPLTTRKAKIEEEGNIVEKTYITWAQGIRLYYYGWTDETTKAKELLKYTGITGEEEEDKDVESDTDSPIINVVAPQTGIFPSSAQLYLQNGNLTEIRNLELKPNALTNSYFITCAYTPSLHYQNIYDTYKNKLAKDEALKEEAETRIQEIKDSLDVLGQKYEELLDYKAELVAELENMMGPALREGSWQADNYTDYGSKYTQDVVVGQKDSSLLSFDWDEKAFDEEQLLYQEFGINQDQIFFPAIDLSEHLEIIKDNLQGLSFIYDLNAGAVTTQSMIVGAQAAFVFIKQEKEIKPLLILLDETFDKDSGNYTNFRLGLASSSHLNEPTILVELSDNPWFDTSTATQCFPRLRFDTLSLKTSEDQLIIKYKEKISEDQLIKYKEKTLKNYSDYYILTREEKYYITIKSEIMLRGGIIDGKIFNVAYSISNAALSLYLDALEVSKTNAYPQVSYNVSVSAFNKNFIKTIYNCLNRIVNIIDNDLKLENVYGYISELEMDLENPWEDKVIIKNYKTKFEDLFASIVASTEQMKTNSFSYNNAASAFGSGGTLKPSVIQNTLNQVDLTYAFQGGSLTIDELNGIWARSDSGVVAMRGGGIFCATEQDDNGNWLWNTGIMPSGLSASLITTGQLDTNLVRIFAGDNLRLQLNADGLFAYKVNDFGNADLNRYIVHNSEGLFSTVKSGNDAVNLVEVSWDGFFIRDENNVEHFSATPDGNLTITGKITATSGKIGPWDITDRGLTSGEYAGLVCAPELDDEGNPKDGYYNVFWVTGKEKDGKQNQCYITNDGTLFCNNIRASGFISANSFIGGISGGEINKVLKNLSLTSDGVRFTFDNRNYDGNLVVEPSVHYLFVSTNSLDDYELGDSDYKFYYNIDIDEKTNLYNPESWEKLDLDESENLLIWKPESLTFVLKNDIMYLDKNNPRIPVQSVYFKVEKKGKSRKINSDSLIELDEKGNQVYEDCVYSSVVQFFSENKGIGKYVSLMDPQSYTFIEDKNQDIPIGNTTKTFSVVLQGFTWEEACNSYWRIDGEEKKYYFQIQGENIGSNESEAGSAAIISDIAKNEDLILNGEILIEDDIIDGNKTKDINGIETDQDKLSVKLVLLDNGDIKAQAIIGYEKIENGGNVGISFYIDESVRSAFCFRQTIGQDNINIILRSSSGSTLMSGDLTTILSTEIWSGRTLLNEDSSGKEFYYVWKKDNKAMSSFNKLKNVSVIDEETLEVSYSNQIETYKVVDGQTTIDFFKQKEIYVTAADFGIKSDYRCDVFTSLEEAKAEYLSMNENLDSTLEII